MTVRDQLHKLIDEIDDQRAEAMLTLLVGSTTRASEDAGSGTGISDDDPFWGLVGLVGDEYEGPTDVSSNIHKYVAEAIEDGWKR
jgi:hypothetical protein